MKIIHIAEIIEGRTNGIRSVLESLIPEQLLLGHEVYLFNLHDNSNKEKWEYYIKMSDFNRNISAIQPHIVIFHGIYKPLFFIYALILNLYRIPYLITPHGGTSRMNLEKGKLKKQIVDFLFVKRFIKKSFALVFLNEQEFIQCIYNKNLPAKFILSNGVHLSDVYKKAKTNLTKDRTIKFLYLSRLDFYYKAVDVLLEAWKKLQNEEHADNMELHIYGGFPSQSDRQKFENYIMDSRNLYYHGMVRGNEKEQAYLQSDIFILTSRSEGMPMSVLEALSYGLPCLVTPQTNMADIIENNNCGWICNLGVEPIAGAIMKASKEFSLKQRELIHNSRESVCEYSWSHIALKSIEIYKEIIKASI